MKPLFLAVAFSGPLLFAGASHAAPAAANYRVVPGKSAGKVWIGAPRETVRRILGKPSGSAVRANGIAVDEWLGPEPKEGESILDQRRFAVLYRKNRAVQIEWNSPDFRTSDGISTTSSLAEFRKKYRPRLRSYLHADPGGGGYRAYDYDDVKRGLAFTFGGQDYYDARVMPETLRVHARGVAVIHDSGGVLKNYRDERPVQKAPR